MFTFIAKNWLSCALVMIIAMVTTEWIYAEKDNRQLKAQLQEQKDHKARIAAMKDMVKAYSKQERNLTSTENGYEAWMTTEQIASRFYKKSDHQFKKEWGLFLATESRKRGVDPDIVFELLKVETGGTFDPELVGPKTKYGRAYGMAQFMTNTAPWIAKMADMPYEKNKLFDPYYSIELSITYLDFLYEEYGNWNKALTAYNRGIYGMKSYVREHGDSRSSYAVTIRQRAEKMNVDYVYGG
ncbi:MAG TPA: transglycosylase SLT domain-containing protein [Bacillales bacterium]|nr:transglycosylase SLT domain-containing protein [Bacillales bacterium]